VFFTHKTKSLNSIGGDEQIRESSQTNHCQEKEIEINESATHTQTLVEEE
jgi:hypothetical protein